VQSPLARLAEPSARDLTLQRSCWEADCCDSRCQPLHHFVALAASSNRVRLSILTCQHMHEKLVRGIVSEPIRVIAAALVARAGRPTSGPSHLSVPTALGLRQ
jgi:hypothetical protein